MSPAERIEALRREIRSHDYQYFVVADPVISDYDYDMLMVELQNLESIHPQLITPDSPTQRVGESPSSSFPVVQHSVPMLSIGNTYNDDEIRDFDRKIHDMLGHDREYAYVVELKIDGVAVSLRYKESLLKLGATRGDGEEGPPGFRAALRADSGGAGVDLRGSRISYGSGRSGCAGGDAVDDRAEQVLTRHASCGDVGDHASDVYGVFHSGRSDVFRPGLSWDAG